MMGNHPPSDMKSKYPQRKKNRKTGFRYDSPGYYMVTMNVRQWRRILSHVVCNEVRLTSVGRMCEHWWRCIPKKYPGVILHEFVFMPDHMHGLLQHDGSVSLFDIMQWYKSITTNRYRKGVNLRGWMDLNGKFWHRAYWDNIIKDDSHLRNVRAYIRANPQRWKR
jgi:putative transposase